MVGRRDRQELGRDAFPWRRRRRSNGHRIELRAELRERDGVKPLELFFDLVFVIAFTQCTALMADEHSWTGLVRGLVVLGVVWWAWVSFAWLTSLVDPEEGSVRIVMFLVMAALLIASFAIPEAFGDRALWFAAAYGFVRLGHVSLFLLGTHDDPDLHRWVVGLSVVTALVVGLLVVASFVGPGWQLAIWFLALAIDCGFPARYGAERWRLVPGHFAERHNLVIILALGESVIALGFGAQAELDASVATIGALGIGLAAALWWIYFDIVAIVTARRLEQAPAGRERNRLARDSYSYLHFPMVAGIVLAALAFEGAVLHGDEPFDAVSAVALMGGVALYLLAHVVLRLRNAGTVNVERLTVALVLLALTPIAVRIDALWTLVAVNVLLWAMIAFETMWVYDDNRFLLRHDLDAHIPSRGDRPPRRPRRGVDLGTGEDGPGDAEPGGGAPDMTPGT
ncbi:low temperature requirement protein A [Dermatobacter hominis]|uniref:low temperature requirement protein A n=1 Tax=Dermatobacter hominis TaxID=2884263 RepID=UPI001D10DCE3|nr:low temperature requirement protein A [Dermatobacter hominis]UDY37880.1 low temperature requirement protein A [Dermatobacter hominis]